MSFADESFFVTLQINICCQNKKNEQIGESLELGSPLK